MDEYTRRAHSVCKLCYHAVFVIKYRRKVMDEEILAYMKDYTLYLIEECYGGKLLEMNGEPDHVHLLFELPPALPPSTVICVIKTQLSKGVRKRYWGKFQPLLWKDSFWSDSYFLTTTGGANIETLEQYIQQQGIEKPKRKYVKKITRIQPHPISSDGVFCYERIKWNNGGEIMKTRYITLSDGVGMGDVLIVIKTNAPKTLLKELETISCKAYKSGDEVPLWWKEVTKQGYEYEIIDSHSHVTAYGTSEDWLQHHKEWGTILEHYVIE